MDDSDWCAVAASALLWEQPPTVAYTGDFAAGSSRWFGDGRLNITESCLDRHVAARPSAVALIAVADDESEQRLTWSELLEQVRRAANVLRSAGVGLGDTVGICLPNIPEAAIAMLACARIGAVHGVVFAGFGAVALASRWRDLACRVVITGHMIQRGGKITPLLPLVAEALEHCPAVQQVFVVGNATPPQVVPRQGHDRYEQQDWQAALAAASPVCAPHVQSGDARLFVLHTSGSTGVPKGLVHGAAGFVLHALLTVRQTMRLQPEDQYACLADLGWITGHAYVLYGPLAAGLPIILDGGSPSFPDTGRYARMIDRLQLSAVFTVPTALRLLAARSAETVRGTSRSTLRVVACAGEILDSSTQQWTQTVFGNGTITVVNIYGQTEASGHLLAGLGDLPASGPGVVPCVGIQASLIDAEGSVIAGPGVGRLVISAPWPGLAQTVLHDHQRFVSGSFAQVPGLYFTGDVAARSASGTYTLLGRCDDELSLSGHRLAPAELESMIVGCRGCSDVCVVGVPDPVRGSAAIVFVVVAPEHSDPTALIRARLRQQMGAFAAPRSIILVPEIPRTRSGKPLRRLLVALMTQTDPGDLSTLADATLPERLRQAIAAFQHNSGPANSSPGD